MYYYKARIYSPTLGRFLQTDPIGYEDQFNLYAYVGNDPINEVDPTGEQRKRPGDTGAVLGQVVRAGIEILAGKDITEALNDMGERIAASEGRVKGTSKKRSRVKRRTARQAQRNASPSVPTSKSGRNPSAKGYKGMRGQIKEGSDGRQAGVVDGSKDRNNDDQKHPPGMEAGRLKTD